MDLQEQKSVNNLIDRQNMMCCIENEDQIMNPADYFDRMYEEYIQTEKEKISISACRYCKKAREVKSNEGDRGRMQEFCRNRQ